MKEEKAIELLRRARRHLNTPGPSVANAVYISPAQQLRNAADDMEQLDGLIYEIDEFLR